MNTRISEAFQRLESSSSKALLPYVTPEYPFPGSTLPLLEALEAEGANLLEMGIPFSDPLADGPTIQHASEIAIRNGATLPLILDTVRRFRSRSSLPILLMGYANPIYHYGVRRFAEDCVAAGVDGVIVPDLPPEEAGELKKESEQRGLSMVFLIAPTTPDARIGEIDAQSTEMSYCVSVRGVTGARTGFGAGEEFERFLERVRKGVKKKFVVGFGVASPEHVRSIWRHADGAVVGSALLQSMQGSSGVSEAVQRAAAFFRTLRPT